MPLVHQFAIILKDSNEKFVSKEMESVEISDSLIQYVGDSLKWINSSWNGKEKKAGISYYGFSIIEDDELMKFIDIINQWKQLFKLAPNIICLTGNFLPDENRYEKEFIDKKVILQNFDSWECLCKRALAMKAKILHNGI